QWEAWAARANVLPLGGWRADGAFSKETHFALKNGAHLERSRAPAVAGRAFTITAHFNAKAPDGVIVAQGGSNHGYALFLDGGQLTFLVRVGGQAAAITSTQAVTGAHTAVARLAADGTMILTLDGQPAARGQAPGLLTTMPTDGLDVGSDKGGRVGPYQGANPFRGTIESVVIQLEGA
ncbi:MAG: arylsulfatase, partial [Planctomycetes bacterium]|nr:arylsulfatase [Planctomycetota bacterium]